jgi:hypothetical protein
MNMGRIPLMSGALCYLTCQPDYAILFHPDAGLEKVVPKPRTQALQQSINKTVTTR